MRKIAIIPARGGSKRIPRKNIKLFFGKPVIAYSIQYALDSGLFDEIIVSTDDEEIAEISRQFGASVPFMRSSRTSGDFATTSDVILELIGKSGSEVSDFDLACCIYPVAPLISGELITDGFNKLIEGKYDSLITVVPFSSSVWRGFKEANGRVEMIWPDNINKRSQDLEDVYHDAGQFYWFRKEAFLHHKKMFMPNCGSLILMEGQAQDIDTAEDWEMAEIKYTLQNRVK